MKKIKLIAFWMAMLSFSSCSESLCPDKLKAGDDDEGGLNQSVLVKYKKADGNWQNVIQPYGYIQEDSVQLYNENYEVEPTFYLSGDIVTFQHADENTPRGEDLSQTYYLYLSYQDTDTIRIDYKINENKCKPLLVYGKFFYNNQLFAQNENEDFIPAAISYKN